MVFTIFTNSIPIKLTTFEGRLWEIKDAKPIRYKKIEPVYMLIFYVLHLQFKGYRKNPLNSLNFMQFQLDYSSFDNPNEVGLGFLAQSHQFLKTDIL